jgi:exopolysaccharide biosynthesis protein
MEENGRTAFWLDRSSRPHIGNPKPGDSVWQAVSDWSSTLILNNNIVPDTTYRILNPHTALGFDDSGKWLLIVVVDGRQPGYSEGMSLHELAWLFRQHGCTQAINMDGGGSSIMMIQKPGSGMETVNRPSGKMPRPVPLMLGIRRSDR